MDSKRLRPLRVVSWLSGFLLVYACGCSGRIEPPEMNGDEAARFAFEEYDRNKDGKLDTAELANCPAIQHAQALIDKDNDGRVSLQELTDRFAVYRQQKIGLVSIRCRVTMFGRPLEGATVRFVPEKFMGPNVKRAEGITDGDGRVSPKIDGQDLPGVACGFYRIEVTKKELAQERVPPKYVGPTILGVEVSGESGNAPIQLKLNH